MDKNKSIYWINNLRAVGIILVIIGHNDTLLTKYIYSFHMPLFLFLSGMLFNDKKWSSLNNYIEHKVKTLLIPYLILSLILYVIWIPLDLIQGKFINNTILIKNFIGIFYSQGVHEYMTWGVPMWFLTMLFVVNILFFIINKYFKTYIGYVIIILSIIGYLFTYIDMRLPWSINVALVGIVFYAIGFLLRDKIQSYVFNKKSYIIVCSLFLISIICSTLNKRVDMYSSIYNNYFLFYLGAISGIFYIVLLVKMLPKNKIMTFIGVNTIYLLAFHIRALEVIKFIAIKLIDLQVDFNSLFIGGIVLPIIQITILLPVIIVIRLFLKKFNNYSRVNKLEI